MKDNDFKPFETVDLLSPAELMPIQGIENPLEPAETGKQENNNTSGPSDENRSNSGFEEFDEGKVFENEYFSGTENLDPNRFFYEEDRLIKEFQEKKKRAAHIVLVAIIAVLCIVTVVLSFAIKRITNNRVIDESSQAIEEKNAYDYTKPNIDYSKQDPVYGVLTIDNNEWLEDGIVRFDPEIIEYTSPYERTLYFKVYPKMDEVTVELSVEMINGYDVSYGTARITKSTIPKGKAGLIPITFYINPDTDLNNIKYSIKWSAFSSYQGAKCPNITKIEEKPGCISVTVEGDNITPKEAYVVLYNNGKVASVLKNQGAYYVKEIVMDFYTMNEYYDSFEVFY